MKAKSDPAGEYPNTFYRTSIKAVIRNEAGKVLYAAATGKDWHDVLKDFHFGNGELIEASGDGGAHVIKLEQVNH